MALSEENGMGTTMLVAPTGGMPYGNYNNGGGFFGGNNDLLGLLFVIALCGGGFGFGGFGGYGAMMGMGMWGMDGLYPWLNNSQNINNGFRDQMISTSINGIQNSITSGFGDVQTALCGGFAGVNQNLCNGFNGVNASISNAQNALTQQMYTNQIADMERSYAAQTANTAGLTNISAQLSQCCCDNRAATADVKYTLATEACANRTAAAQNTRDIIDSQNRGTQAILDKLCALELDGVKGQLAQAQRDNVALQNAINMATMRESQTAQTAAILQGQNNEIDALYNRLKNCPVNSVPVYGSQPIFTCNNGGCGCGA